VTWRRHCLTVEATRLAGEQLASLLAPGDVVLLVGPLGAGKTTFAQGVARGLGVTERVTSPTFVMVRSHHCAPGSPVSAVHHADLYRVEHLGEVHDLALGELVEEDAVALVEWGQLAATLLGDDVLVVDISRGDDDAREVAVSGARAASRARALATWAAA
jgi:tRNA threonylcarbamoyladenosine biosynthesis protein TsaE